MAHKFKHLWVLCLLVVACQGEDERARYDNYRLYRAVASSEKQLQVLKHMESSSDSIIFMNGVHHLNENVQMVVAPHKVPDFLEVLSTNGVEFELLEKNLQKQLEGEVVGKFNRLARSSSYNWHSYFTLEDTYEWLEQLAEENPGVVTLIEGGTTYEGRDILGVKISKSLSEKPGILLEAGIHAREWIAPATATYIINELLTSKENTIQELAENYDFYIFPHANPDGYVYTHTKNRLWRKTRSRYGSCYGADPNRNWDFHWNSVGSSNNPCDDTYAGPSAFSEIETRTFAEYLETLRGKIRLYISFHAFSQYLLYPYGHTASLPENIKDYRQVFDKTVAAISQRYGTKYTGGNIYDAIYPASGASVDWAFANIGAKMAFCYELRPSQNSYFVGFRLPPSKIREVGEETLDSIVAMINEMQKLGYFK